MAATFRELRLAAGLSTSELGRMIGSCHQVVSRWENRKSKPRAKYIPELAKALKMSPLELVRLFEPAKTETTEAAR